MDPRVRFVGVLAKDAKLIEGGMRKEVSPILPADKDDLFYLRIISHLKELKDLASTLGDLGYGFIKMAKISFVYLSLKDSRTLLVRMGGEAATRAGISQSQTLPNRLRRQEVNTQKL